jgi:hypothetical protein
MLPPAIGRVEVARDPQSTVAGLPAVIDIAFK